MKESNGRVETYIAALICKTSRGLVENMNDYNIKKEDVISIFKENEAYVLIYQRPKEDANK